MLVGGLRWWLWFDRCEIKTFLTLLMLGSSAPSAAEGGASNEVGASSADGDVQTRLVGVTTAAGAELGDGGVKVSGSTLRMGLFRGGPVGDRARLAWRQRL